MGAPCGMSRMTEEEYNKAVYQIATFPLWGAGLLALFLPPYVPNIEEPTNNGR